MSNIAIFKGANLPAPTTLTTALRGLSSEVSSGDVILKMDKTGVWVYGADNTDVEEDSTWAINPFSFAHGWVAWGEGEKLGEKMVPMTQPVPEPGDAPPGAKRGWEQQVGFRVRCMSGEDEGLECVYAVSSVGGKRAVQKMGLLIADKVEEETAKGTDKVVPVVKLEDDHYQHKTYGKIFTPVFTIVDWLPMAPAAEEKKAAPAPEPEAPPPAAETGRRRRRRSA